MSLRTIREWAGSQNRAFEELCYQLRDPTPEGAELVKTGNPDAGLEWYFKFGNGVEWGWQAKYSFEIGDLLKEMEASLKAVCKKRRNCRRLTFCIPFDLPDGRRGKEQKSAREKFEDRKRHWRERIEGADRVTIELWSEGELLERLARPERRGIEWFFWSAEVFGPAWLQQRLEVTARTAGKRYSPELNIEIPIAFALEGLGRSDEFLRRYRRIRGAVVKASRRPLTRRFAGVGKTRELAALRKSLRDCVTALEPDAAAQNAFQAKKIAAAVSDTRENVWAALPTGEQEEGKSREKASDLRHALGELGRALGDAEEFLASPAALAAEQGCLVMTGEAGQGKTHLFCDAGRRALEAGRPCVVLLGQQLTGENVFSNLIEQLGLPGIGAAELFGAMRAAAEASGQPFVILIDALNDSGDPSAWRSSLPGLLSEAATYAPWIAVGVSVRSSYADVIQSGLPDDVRPVEHPGLAGYEHEGAERYFEAFNLRQPNAPLLLPEFTNPLFLRLYCEALASGRIVPPEHGFAHITEVLQAYLEAKDRDISAELALDPRGRTVEQAVAAFADAAAEQDGEWLPRETAKSLIDGHASHLNLWPRTLFGQLLSEGVLTADRVYERGADGDWGLVEGVRFTFQRLADYQIAERLIGNRTHEQLEQALRPSQPLRTSFRSARAGLIEALAVLLPERFGIELLDAANWRHDPMTTDTWHEATLASMAARRDDAVTTRTRELLRRISGRSQHLFEQATRVLLSITARPAHPLNGAFLHEVLMRWPMPTRDAAWGIETYGGLSERGPLDRLVRWAARGAEDDYSDEIVELASIPLIWTFSSPDRRLRDYVTKALRRLLAPRPTVLADLLQRFRAVDDPYVLQRLGVVAHGAVLTSGDRAPENAVLLARALLEIATDPATCPDILLRDAARGAMEWCLQRGLIGAEEYGTACPPYSSDPPSRRPRTLKQLERAYERTSYDSPDPGYGSLFISIFSMGDFGRYVIESDVTGHFSNVPLTRPAPRRRKARRRKPDKKRVDALIAGLTEEQIKLMAEEESDAFYAALSDEQRHELLQALDPPPVQPKPRAYPAELAQRWVFERVIELGWTPELFGRFDRRGGYDLRSGRSGHKPERFGKKYQWIAVHELLARIADNFHMMPRWGDEGMTYTGPWQFLGRDIDPTLPPAPRGRDRDGGEEGLGATYAAEDEAWWIPDGPRYAGELPPADSAWSSDTSDIPGTRALVMRTDHGGTDWVVLQAYYNWDEEPAEDEEWSERRRRDMWSYIYSWILEPKNAEALCDHLGAHTLMGRWMPEGPSITDAAYIAEMPWAAAANEYPVEWEEIRSRGETDAPSIEVLPGWLEYSWEGSVWDCSIDEGVSARMPARALYDAGGLEWVIEAREWTDAQGEVVAQLRESTRRASALLVRRDWLERTLNKAGWSLVLGRLGEKQLIEGGFAPRIAGRTWTEIDGLISFHAGQWRFTEDRFAVKHTAE
jgi:hypothetical protein